MATARLFSITARRNGGLISSISSCARGAGIAHPQSSALFGGISMQRWLSTSYPAHEVVGMPSLSPVSFTQSDQIDFNLIFIECMDGKAELIDSFPSASVHS